MLFLDKSQILDCTLMWMSMKRYDILLLKYIKHETEPIAIS